MGWTWLTVPEYRWGFVLRVVLKAALLFVLLNVVYALTNPLPLIGQVSIYNGLVPGRARLPYGEDPASYNLSPDNLETMFATHEVGVPKAPDEYRVLLIGDSATWGVLLQPDETLSAALNAGDYVTADGRTLRFYNLGHPVLSLTKDLLLLDYARRYQPDMIVWPVTLQSLARSRQLEAPLVQANTVRVRDLIARYDLALDANVLPETDFGQRTIVGQRRDLADWLRLQLYGVMWAATRIDQVYPDFTLRTSDFEPDVSWLDYAEPQPLTAEQLALDVLVAGHAVAAELDIPLLLVNEPIFISTGVNSDLRYNLWYPRWAYDAYRDVLRDLAEENAWPYLDVWDRIAPDEFTDSPVHLTPDGTQQLAALVGAAVMEQVE